MERIQTKHVVNDRQYDNEIDTRTTLVDYLREHLGFTSVHVGCRTGNCGACTVVLDGATVKSCCILAADTDGAEIMTVEALSSGPEDLHPVQQAFVEKQGLQCGFCTPGMVLSTLQLLKEIPDPTPAEIRRAISGNLCRCTGYQFIVDSALRAAELLVEND
jgi:carbon-monoxide dehydrogenase small subunit